jgi:hypothetical protein
VPFERADQERRPQRPVFISILDLDPFPVVLVADRIPLSWKRQGIGYKAFIYKCGD